MLALQLASLLLGCEACRTWDGALSLRLEVQPACSHFTAGRKVSFQPCGDRVSQHPAKFPQLPLRDLSFRARKRFLGTEPHLQQSQTELDSNCGRSREKWLWNGWSCHFIKEQRKHWCKHGRRRQGRTRETLKRSSLSLKSQVQICPHTEQSAFMSHCSSLWLQWGRDPNNF